MGVDLVQPVAMRSAVFCVVCNLSMCVPALKSDALPPERIEAFTYSLGS